MVRVKFNIELQVFANLVKNTSSEKSSWTHETDDENIFQSL